MSLLDLFLLSIPVTSELYKRREADGSVSDVLLIYT